MRQVDVVIVGSGPNGLAAAVTLARAGLSVEVFEREDTIGGGSRTAELTLPGFRHDVCSAVHPMAVASPFFRAFELERRIELITPGTSYAHPLDGGRAGIAYHDLDRTVEGLGRDGAAWRRLMGSIVRRADEVGTFANEQLIQIPEHPVDAVRYALKVLEQGSPAWNVRFSGDEAPAMLSGVAAHGIGRMPRLATSGVGMLLGAYAHARGWPIPRGGSQAIVDALADDLRAHGGVIHTGHDIRSLADLPQARARLFDVTPRALAAILGDALPAGYRRSIGRFRYGSGVAKLDLALNAPVPWANPEVALAGTVHLGGTRAAIAASERDVARGIHPENPFLLLAQPTVHDPSRAPAGKHVVWAYSHVPHGSDVDVSERMIAQIERFAPGFRDTIEAVSYRSAVEVEAHNPNYVGGDISAGAVTLMQLLKRPVISPDPWRTPHRGSYLASSSTPPGPAVHGLCGFYAARSALRHEFGVREVPALGLGAQSPAASSA